MNDILASANSPRRDLARWQEAAVRRLTFGVLGLAIAAMVVGTLVNWWNPTPGGAPFSTVFGLVMLAVFGVRHAYLRGVADATAHQEGRATAR